MTEQTSSHDEKIHTDHPVDRRGGLNGKWLIGATLSLFIIVPAVTVLSLRMVKADLTGINRKVTWAGRAGWTILPASRVSLKLDMMASAQKNREYRQLPFNVTAEQDQLLRRCASLAKQSKDQFKSQATFDKLTELAEQLPKSFYPPYLLGIWHRLHGDDDRFNRRMSQAITHAQAVIVQPVVNDDQQPAEHLAIGRIDLGLDRVVDDKLDQSLVLVYPHLKTDQNGRAYMPVPKSIYRVEHIDTKHIRTPLANLPRWFTFPGHVGRMPLWHADTRSKVGVVQSPKSGKS